MTRDSVRRDHARVLLVDDNPNDLALTQRALRRAQLASDTVVARDGAEALTTLFGSDTEPGTSPLPSLVLLDLKLPKVDGLEVLARLKGDPRTRSIPVVVLTSSLEPRDVAEGYRLGVNSYVVKPVNFDAYAETIERVGVYWLTVNQPPREE